MTQFRREQYNHLFDEHGELKKLCREMHTTISSVLDRFEASIDVEEFVGVKQILCEMGKKEKQKADLWYTNYTTGTKNDI